MPCVALPERRTPSTSMAVPKEELPNSLLFPPRMAMLCDSVSLYVVLVRSPGSMLMASATLID